MENIHPLLFFAAGVFIGISIFPVFSLLESKGINALLDALGRVITLPLRLIAMLFKKRGQDVTQQSISSIQNVQQESVDPREQAISDATQILRSIIHSLATAVHNADKAATDSSQTLAEVKASIEKLHLPEDLSEINIQLLNEVDRVVSSNHKLKMELASSRKILEIQKEQIENLKTAVRIDGLTQLANRAYFDEKLAELISVYRRYEEPFSLLMIDIDNFKSINDTLGHQGGDRILKGVAYKIKSALRESDFVARYGGDEFSVIIIKADGAASARLADKICGEVKASRFILDGIEVTTTLSIGIAEIVKDETAEDLLERADKALYRVKETGRNGVVLAEKPLPASEESQG